MKGIDIIEAFQNIDDDMILHARQHRKPMPVWLRWTSVAAVLLCTVILMAMMLAKLLGGPTGTNPDPNQPDVLAPVEDSEVEEDVPSPRKELQSTTQQALLREIESLSPLRPEGIAGSVVVLDVNSFQVLSAAAASSESGDETPEDRSMLPTRVLSEAGAPGSTFQMITAITAMRSGITPDFTVEDSGYYLRYEDIGYTPGCRSSGFQGHGTVTMVDALAKNCDTYFYALADSENYSIEELNTVAQSFGLGLPTGIGQPESTGQLSTPELKQAYYGEDTIDGEWYFADNLIAATGQGLTRVTSMQLCRYTAALANGGTLLPVSLDGSGGTADTSGVSRLLSKEEYKTITEGMRRCALEGSTASVLENVGISVCCSAGTVTDLTGYNDDAVFTCWAPAYEPEIAIAVCLTHGGDAREAASVAADILREYFGQTTDSVPSGENASVLEPTAEPTSVPTALPTPTPTSLPTPTPTTEEAISEASSEPTAVPTPTPTPVPTPTPTPEPTSAHSAKPDAEPVAVPTVPPE